LTGAWNTSDEDLDLAVISLSDPVLLHLFFEVTARCYIAEVFRDYAAVLFEYINFGSSRGYLVVSSPWYSLFGEVDDDIRVCHGRQERHRFGCRS
jgi:hypothetical protein